MVRDQTMSDTPESERFSLARWSRLKREADAAPEVSAPVQPPPEPAGKPELPPVESLTIDSDFTAFMQPEVDEGVRRAAIKQLFRDPRFNVMDGLDTYIDDYSQPDPIPAGMLAQLKEVARKLEVLGDEETGAESNDAKGEAVTGAGSGSTLPADAGPPGPIAASYQRSDRTEPNVVSSSPSPPKGTGKAGTEKSDVEDVDDC
jgi:hypothetical protein